MKKILNITFFCVFLFFLAQGSVCAEVTIYLKNGKQVKAESYYNDGGMLYYDFHGQLVGIPESLVVSVEDLAESSRDKEIEMKIPSYLRVSSRSGFIHTGIFEAQKDRRGTIYYAQVFQKWRLHSSPIDKENVSWRIGTYRDYGGDIRYTDSFILSPVPVGRGPRYNAIKWRLTGSYTKTYSDIVVENVPPPESTDMPLVFIDVEGAPVTACNGRFTPFTYRNGWPVYRLKNGGSEVTLYLYYAPSFRDMCQWVFAVNGRVYYKGGLMPVHNILQPYEVTQWSQDGLVALKVSRVSAEGYTIKKSM